jgi:hypothetical protein
MAMTAKILKGNGRVVYRSSFIPVTEDEMKDPNIKKDMETFDRTIELKLGGTIKDEDYRDDETPDYIPYSEDDLDPAMGDPPKQPPERDEVDVSTYDPYIGAEVLLPHQGRQLTAKVKNRKQNAMGDLIGHSNANPILDTRLYEVEFPDGSEATYSANVIAENMLSQCDSEGRQYLLVRHVVDHKKDDDVALKPEDAYVTVNGRKS